MSGNISRVYRYLGSRGLIVAFYFSLLTKIARLLGKKTLVRSVLNYKLHLDIHDRGLSRTLFLFGKREIDHYLILHSIVKPGMNVLDIGANIGYYTIMESLAIGRTGCVTAIEPMLPNIELLRKNLLLNRIENVEVIHGAVSVQTGIGQMFKSTHSNLHTFHNEGSAVKTLNSHPIDVPTFTLRDVVYDRKKPDLIRMDVEGHEVEILSQLVQLTKSKLMSPNVIFETHLSRYNQQNDLSYVLRQLFDLGYQVVKAASSNESGTKRVSALGYIGSEPFYSDFVHRVIFENIDDDDAIDLICRTGGLRTILLSRTQ